MSIRDNKVRADRLAGEALVERRARKAHAARAKAIFLDRLGSPGGLAFCFGAGAVAGLRLGRGGEASDAPDRDEAGTGGREEGFLERFSDSPIGNIAVRLAAATIVRYLLTPGGGGEGEEAGESAAADAGGP